jgi:glyoxylase-like metal-dependent hydrolase (beta-lactamase superfamily II)
LAAALATLMIAPAIAQGELEVLAAQGNVFMIVGPGGNTAVQVGHEAVVVVDTQTAAASDELLAAIKKLSAKPIRHIINTSADAEHTGGNEAVSRAGTYVRLIDTFDPRGQRSEAGIFAHVNVLGRMSAPTGTEAPAGSWPSDTYFTKEWALFVNGEALQLIHVPEAHTDGDTLVFFRRSDVIATGDIYNTSRYPRFDARLGGSVAGVLEGLNTILDIAIPGENQEGGTVVIPGHGRLSDETEVANYRDMVTIVRDRVAAMIEAGMTLEQVQAAQPTSDYDGIYDEPNWTGAMFVAAVYHDLAGAAR